jgi:hypothetical protein
MKESIMMQDGSERFLRGLRTKATVEPTFVNVMEVG